MRAHGACEVGGANGCRYSSTFTMPQGDECQIVWEPNESMYLWRHGRVDDGGDGHQHHVLRGRDASLPAVHDDVVQLQVGVQACGCVLA